MPTHGHLLRNFLSREARQKVIGRKRLLHYGRRNNTQSDPRGEGNTGNYPNPFATSSVFAIGQNAKALPAPKSPAQTHSH